MRLRMSLRGVTARGFSERTRRALCVLLAGLAIAAASPARAIDAYIVMDANAHTVIASDNPDRLLYPASMTKMMTLYLAFEAMDQGRMSLQRMLPVSAHAQSMSPTKLGLVAKQTIRMQDAILGLVTQSANDAAVVVAEALGGSEARFAQLMTRKAHELGMVNTNFRNASGLPDNGQISTARDMAILAQALIRNFPGYYKYFSTREFTYKGVTYANHNHLMERYPGMDGLKTGLINASGFNLAASAVRNGRRLIAVVFGGTSARQRDDYMAKLLDAGFEQSGGTAMQIADRPPVPGRKPTDDASMFRVTSTVAASAAAGQGDTQSAGDVRPAAPEGLAPPITTTAAAIQPPPSTTPPSSIASLLSRDATWGIQVGAFSSRAASERAIRQAVGRAPSLLNHAVVSISEVAQGDHTIYRARLFGLNEAEAQRACQTVDNCLPIAPGS